MVSIVKVDQIKSSDGTTEYLNAGNIKNATLDSSVTNNSGVSSGAISSNATFPAGMILEEFMSPCDGSIITVQSGTYTVQNVTTALALTTSFVDFTGSSITYTPPTGTQTVIYTFSYQWMWEDADAMFMHRLKIGGNEVTKARRMYSHQGGSYQEMSNTFQWAFHIGGSSDTTTGRQADWTSGKEIKLETREHSASQEVKVHASYHWDGSASYQNPLLPLIGIKAIAG